MAYRRRVYASRRRTYRPVRRIRRV